MRTPRPISQALRGTRRQGFTLVELLVVIAIMTIVVGLAFPFMRSTLRGASVDLAVGQVNNGIAAARAYATRYKPFITARRVGATLRTSDDNGDGYSGAIALFGADGSIRILENDENAATPGGRWMEFESPPLNGYRPIEDLDDLLIPGRSLVLGIVRTGSGDEDVRLIPPPFAIRFSRAGVLVQGEARNNPPTEWQRYVYVNGEGESRTLGSGVNQVTQTVYRTTYDRDAIPSVVNDEDFWGEFGRRGETLMPDGRTQVPFDAIETVSGVLVVDPEQVPDEWDGDATNFNRTRLEIYTTQESAAILKWSATSSSARVLFFNRYTGQDLTR